MIDTSYRTMMILHLALMTSLGMYVFVLFTVTQGQEPHALEPVIFYALAAMGAMLMAVIPILRGRMLPPMKEAAALSETVPDGPAVQQAIARVFTASLISWSLCEAIAIFGFLLSFMSFNKNYFFAFGGVSLLNFLLYRPSKELLLGAARAAG